MLKKVMMFFVTIFCMISIVGCKDENVTEIQYLPFDIKVVDDFGGEWILTEENTSIEGALQLSFNDSKSRKFRCTYFKIYGEKDGEKNWWGDKWNPNNVTNFWVSCDVAYKGTASEKYSKKDNNIVDIPGYYSVMFSGERNGVWNDYLQYRIFIEVQA